MLASTRSISIKSVPTPITIPNPHPILPSIPHHRPHESSQLKSHNYQLTTHNCTWSRDHSSPQPSRSSLPPPMNTLSMKTSTSGGANVMQSIDIQSFSYQERSAVIPLLTNSFANCGGWVLERRTLSTTTVEFRLEIQLLAVLDLYAAILSA